ncbi:MAG: 9-O-acetylesterase [Planctomycetia bacterium]|nr:9-O-acetylesterase [Planctomycetia bacterium]
MKIPCVRILSSAAILVTGLAAAQANVRLPAIISDNMVLQADKPAPIWGWADAGEEVTVSTPSVQQTTKADDKGRWEVKLPPHKASAEPIEMTVKGKNTLQVKNILVGEVWGGSGQSNMQWSVAASTKAQEEIAAANYPQIRLFIVPNRLSSAPLDDVVAKWVVCSPQTVAPSSAVLYFFGREIHKAQNVPMGLITCAWGGSRVQPWITPAKIAGEPGIKKEHSAYNTQRADRAAARKTYLAAMKNWLATAENAAAAGNEFADPPPVPADPAATFTSPAAMYNGMVHGIAPYALRGWLWYQGESNRGEGMYYTECMKALIESWRTLWGDVPFLFVQLAPFYYDTNETALPELWEAQTATLAVPNTGMAVTTDITTIRDIHPPNKQDVGKRLALWALANSYGKKDLVHSGPLYDSMAVEGSKIRLKFKHTGGGLVSRDGKDLSWFTIAGEDKQFHKADSKIDGDSIVVSSPAVSSPVAVRFGWNQIAEPNLANKAGLPASPFRTDKWTDAKN